MMKMRLISMLIKFVLGAAALGIGIWYLSSSIGGDALTYSSMENFLRAIGADGDIASANGCFLCGYMAQLFAVIGNAAEMFWDAIVDILWVLLCIGFGIYMFVYTGRYLADAMSRAADNPDKEQKIEFKPWFDNIWRRALRILVVGALMGTLSLGGGTAMRVVTRVTITPVMYVGAQLARVATNTISATKCSAMDVAGADTNDLLNPVMAPFMCAMGNLNAVILAGAAGGFAMMNYAWMGMGGGVFTWVAGLVTVILFLIIGFNLAFQVLSVVFKLVFLIIFLPVFLAAYAFEGAWAAAGGFISRGINMLVSSAVRIVAITLKILILYATVSFAADEFFPGPADGYNALMPPIATGEIQNPDAQTAAVAGVFTECESVAMVDGVVDGDKFKQCFIARRDAVEGVYPGAFDFLHDGWNFMLVMLLLFMMYYYAISPKVDGLLGKDGAESFDYGKWVKDFGKTLWAAPRKIFESISKKVGGN